MLTHTFAKNCPYGFPSCCGLHCHLTERKSAFKQHFFVSTWNQKMQSQRSSDADGYNLPQNQSPFLSVGCTGTGKSRKSQDVYTWKEKLKNKTICLINFFFYPASEVAQHTACRYQTNYCGLLSFYFQNHQGCKCNYLASWLKCENTNLA